VNRFGVSDKTLALAGIIATAVVGVAGATSAWLIAHGQRTDQRVIAHDGRVYDRSADMYLAALEKIQQQKEMISAERLKSEAYAPPSPVPPLRTNIMARTFDSNLNARVIAFGSKDAVQVYGQLHQIANQLFNEENVLREQSKFGTQPYNLALARALTDFHDREMAFQAIVHRQLS
jgi:hypothetical protein